MPRVNLLRPVEPRTLVTDDGYTAEQWALIFLALMGELILIALFFWVVS